jgi:hypothetical protein
MYPLDTGKRHQLVKRITLRHVPESTRTLAKAAPPSAGTRVSPLDHRPICLLARQAKLVYSELMGDLRVAGENG